VKELTSCLGGIGEGRVEQFTSFAILQLSTAIVRYLEW
jgi:hypothetical protein